MTALVPGPVVDVNRTFERLYRDHAQDVSRYALAVLGDRADAEDITQTTFLNAYRALRRGERPRTPGHWLIAIAHNACRERFRYGQRRPQEVAFVEEVSAAAVRDDDAPTAEELQGALLQLPTSQRAALVMRELEGRPYAEIAKALGVSLSAVETLLFRARQALREQLEEQLSCSEAVLAISTQAGGALTHGDRANLRAHLRRCPECAQLARSRRAQRTVLRGLLPLPSWLSSLLTRSSTSAVGASGSGGVGAVGLVAKAAALVVTGAVVGGGVSAGATHIGWHRAHRQPITVPSDAPGRAHSPARPTGSHAPGAGTLARPKLIELPGGSPGEPQDGAGPQAASGPGGLASADPAPTGTPGVPRVSPANSPQRRPSTAGANGKGASGASAKGKAAATAQASKKQQGPVGSAAAHANPKANLPAAAATPAQGNGAANGQANGQGSGQANGQANGQATVPVGPPADVPAQSNSGGNGHH